MRRATAAVCTAISTNCSDDGRSVTVVSAMNTVWFWPTRTCSPNGVQPFIGSITRRIWRIVWLAWPAWVMFAIVFLWQPPHFYALAIKFKDDYARAGIPMLPVVASMRRVGVEVVAYTWLTVAASLALWPLGMTPVYGLTAVVVGVLFMFEAHRFAARAFRGAPVRPMRLFHLSITYLTLLFVAVAVDALIH